MVNCGPQSIIDLSDEKTITCITFDSFGLDGKFIASNGVFLENYGVVEQPNCGVDNNCGRFSPPSRLQIPRFTNADFFELTVSLWFKGTGALVTNGVCSDEGAKTYVDECIQCSIRNQVLNLSQLPCWYRPTIYITYSLYLFIKV